ncbi:MAG: hypothetical protein Q4E47_00680 [Candidatus Saccharibacteria bacterium]|nr:hypothetical protein [Candidatus Saccharibacteria bacterium]
MKKLFSLIKAGFSQDLNLFEFQSKSRGASKYVLVSLVGLLVMYCVGNLTSQTLDGLMAVGAEEAILPLVAVLLTGLVFFEGIYKAGGILFESKDNDMLFAMPIPKHQIIILRLAKFLAFEYIYIALFFIPVLAVYIFKVQPSPDFYIASLITFFTLPILPIVVSSIIGFLVKLFTSRFKAKRVMSTVLTLVFSALFVAAIAVVSIQNENDNTNMLSDISGAISANYYPAKAYLDLSHEFNLETLGVLICINYLPLILVVMIFSKSYFRIIARLSEHAGPTSNKTATVKASTKISSLLRRELSRFFASTTYVFNATFGLIMMILATGALVVYKGKIMEAAAQVEESGFSPMTVLPFLYCGAIVLTSCMTCLTSSSISLEGKSFGLTTSLPILPRELFRAKILFSNVITIPVILLCDIVFCIAYTPSMLAIVLIFLFSIIVPTMNATLGLIINLRFPKMQYSNETEIIKQSTSSLISTFGGMGIAFASLLPMVPFTEHMDIYFTVLLAIMAVVLFVLKSVLYSWGEKRWRSLEA